MRLYRPLLALLLAVTMTSCSTEEPVSGPRPSSSPPSPSADLSGPPQASEDRDPGAGREVEGVLETALRQGPARPRTAQKAAAMLVAAERAIGSPATRARRLAVAGGVQQLAYRELGGRPEWDERVLASVPVSLRSVVRDNVSVRREFRSMHDPTTASDTLPAWRIVSPAPARALLRFYRRAEAEFGVGWEYLAAINLVETGMGRIRGTSTAGAQGPMQFIPSTWAAYGEGDINDPRDAISAAARYLAANGFARPGGIDVALYRYNNSTAYVRGVRGLAEIMERRPRAFYGYYHWQVYYLTSSGDVLLPEGYATTQPIFVRRWLRTHPQS